MLGNVGESCRHAEVVDRTVLSYGGVDRDYARMDNNLLAQFIYMA